MTLVIRDARVVTAPGAGALRGRAMDGLTVIERGDVVVSGQRVESVHDRAGGGAGPRFGDADEIDAGGRVLMAGFVDAHTHLCWAGDRLDEWERKRAGATYLEILESGGGIMSTVRAVRGASERELAEGLRARLDEALREGTTSVEVKSGYGLTTADELKMLRAIASAGAGWPGRVSATACLGHAIPAEAAGDPDGFVERTISETLREVTREFPRVAVDAYCERGAWSAEQCRRLFEAAMNAGHPVRVHTDQFGALGMTEWAIEHAQAGARSVDHLEATAGDVLERVGSSGLLAVGLPCSGFHLDGRYADLRRVVDAGGGVVVATNANPGSAPCQSVPMAVALAVRHCGLTAREAITAVTANGAALLGFDDAGRVEPGARADLVLLRHRDERMLGYEFGGDPVDAVVCGGRVVKRR